MADNTLINLGSGGDTIRDLDRSGGGIKTQVVQLDFGGSASNAEQLASLSNPLPIQPAASYFAAGTGNTSTAQLAASATFTGTIESVLSQVAASILILSDQPFTVTLNQYITPTDYQPCETESYSIAANTHFSHAIILNGNYFNLTVQNTGAALTTKLNINTYYGTMMSNGQQKTATSLPVVVTSDQTTAASTQPAFASQAVTVADRATGATSAAVPSSAMYCAGTFTTTLPTVTTGQMVGLQTTNRGETLVSLSNAGTAVAVTAASAQPAFATAALTVADRSTGATASAVPSSIQYCGGTFTTTQPTITTGQLVGLQTTARGALLVSLASVDNTATAAGFVKLTDGTTAAPVTAASTAAATGAAALNVSLSPNSPTPATTSANQACTAFVANAVGTATAVKATGGNVFGFSLINNNAATVFVEFFNVAAASVVLGTTTPVAAYVIPASGTLTVPPSSIANFNNATAIAMAATTTFNGAVTGSVTGTVFYK